VTVAMVKFGDVRVAVRELCGQFADHADSCDGDGSSCYQAVADTPPLAISPGLRRDLRQPPPRVDHRLLRSDLRRRRTLPRRHPL